MKARDKVLASFPDAQIVSKGWEREYFVIYPDMDSEEALGDGPTEAEAWCDAALNTRVK